MSEHNQLLRLERLVLRNFRCFETCEVDFHPNLTVLVAENGKGKSAILDALRKSLLIFTQTVGRTWLASSIDETDIRLDRDASPQLPTRFEVDTVLLGEKHHVGREVRRFRRRPRNTRSELKHYLDRCASLQDAAFGSTLPLAAFFGTGRLYDQHRLTSGKLSVVAARNHRVGAYVDSLSHSASYKAFAAWYESQMNALANPAERVGSHQARPEQLLAAVEAAVKTVLAPTGWSEIGWEPSHTIGDGPGAVFKTGRIRLRSPDAGWLPLDYLSDGILNMVALVADIAHKCARLNPHFGPDAAHETPGVVLIDEVEMHLHPQWQQKLIGLLREAFPQIQFIVTTHSPHVLTTVNADSIRIITVSDGVGSAPIPQVQTCGDESGNVLARTMHVDPVPNVLEARLLSEYRSLVQNGKDRDDRAQTIWPLLLSHFGEGHHLLQEAAVLRDLQEFKREYRRESGGHT